MAGYGRMMEYFQAFILGLVEAATEFLPVSSTGHLILAGKLLNFEGPPGHVFEVAIQLGAVLAVVVLYFQRLFGVLMGLRRDPAARHFAIVTIIGFIPAVIAGYFLHDIITQYLFNPWVVCIALLLGGFAIIAVEKLHPAHRIASIEEMPYKTALIVGFAQCLALVPGVSRSGATILGALCCGVERKTAAEFSFFQAVPLIAGATVYDIYKNRNELDSSGSVLIAIGFITAFVGSLFIIRWMIDFVSRHGFTPFAWYRIAVGTIGLIALTVWA